MTADQNGRWLYTFTDLPKYDLQGNEYVYTVSEANVPENYSVQIDGYNLINVYEGDNNSSTTDSGSSSTSGSTTDSTDTGSSSTSSSTTDSTGTESSSIPAVTTDSTSTAGEPINSNQGISSQKQQVTPSCSNSKNQKDTKENYLLQTGSTSNKWFIILGLVLIAVVIAGFIWKRRNER